ncbi:MAG: hypothetical protein IAF38_06620 [Bacteroidia bacterium]|nr:hypothetical protein [Bacteroidia bacterium]
MQTEEQVLASFTPKDLKKIEEKLETFSKEKKKYVYSFYIFLAIFSVLFCILLFADEFPYWTMTFISAAAILGFHAIPYFFYSDKKKKLLRDQDSGIKLYSTDILTKKEIVQMENTRYYIFHFNKKLIFVDERVYEYGETGMKFDIFTTQKQKLVLELKPHTFLADENDFV